MASAQSRHTVNNVQTHIQRTEHDTRAQIPSYHQLIKWPQDSHNARDHEPKQHEGNRLPQSQANESHFMNQGRNFPHCAHQYGHEAKQQTQQQYDKPQSTHMNNYDDQAYAPKQQYHRAAQNEGEYPGYQFTQHEHHQYAGSQSSYNMCNQEHDPQQQFHGQRGAQKQRDNQVYQSQQPHQAVERQSKLYNHQQPQQPHQASQRQSQLYNQQQPQQPHQDIERQSHHFSERQQFLSQDPYHLSSAASPKHYGAGNSGAENDQPNDESPMTGGPRDKSSYPRNNKRKGKISDQAPEKHEVNRHPPNQAHESHYMYQGRRPPHQYGHEPNQQNQQRHAAQNQGKDKWQQPQHRTPATGRQSQHYSDWQHLQHQTQTTGRQSLHWPQPRDPDHQNMSQPLLSSAASPELYGAGTSVAVPNQSSDETATPAEKEGLLDGKISKAEKGKKSKRPKRKEKFKNKYRIYSAIKEDVKQAKAFKEITTAINGYLTDVKQEKAFEKITDAIEIVPASMKEVVQKIQDMVQQSNGYKKERDKYEKERDEYEKERDKYKTQIDQMVPGIEMPVKRNEELEHGSQANKVQSVPKRTVIQVASAPTAQQISWDAPASNLPSQDGKSESSSSGNTKAQSDDENKLQKELEAMKEKYHGTTAELLRLKNENNALLSYGTENTNLKRQLADSKTQSEQLQSRITHLTNEKKQLERSNQDTKSEITRLEAKLVKVEQQIENLRAENNSLKQQREKHALDQRDAGESAYKTGINSSLLDTENRRMKRVKDEASKSENLRFKDALRSHGTEITALKSQIVGMEARIKQMQSDLADLTNEKEQLERSNHEANSEITRLNDELLKMNQQIENLQAENDALREQQGKRALAQREAEESSFRTNIGGEASVVNHRDDIVGQLQSKCQELQERLKASEKRHHEFEQNLTQEKEELSDKLSRVRDKYEKLKAAQKENENNVRSILDEKDKLAGELKEARDENKRLKTSQNGAESQEKELKKAEVDIQSLKASLARQLEESDAYKKTTTRLEAEVAQLKEECDKWKGKTERRDRRIEELQDKADSQEQEIKKLKRKLTDVHNDWDDDIDKRETKYRKLERQLEQETSDLRRRIEKLQEEKDDLRRPLDEEPRPTPPPHDGFAIRAVVPKYCKEDSRIQGVMKTWLSDLQAMGEISIRVSVKDGRDIEPSDGLVLLHVFNSASSPEKEIDAAFKKNKLDRSVDVLVIVWHHKAEHVRFPRPSRDLLDRAAVADRCVRVCDAFFFQGVFYRCHENQQSLKETHDELKRRPRVPATPRDSSPRPQRRPGGVTLVLPRSSAEDERVTPVFEELKQQLQHVGLRIQVTVKDGRDITRDDGIVILPCIAASRVGSDLAAALDKAKLGQGVRLVIIIFNHKAAHDCRMSVPTRDRLADQETVKRCLLFLDAIFWQGRMYDCKVNQQLVAQLKELLAEEG